MYGAGHVVFLIHHKRSVAASIEKKGVSIRELSGKVVRSHVQTRTRLSRADKPDFVLVTVRPTTRKQSHHFSRNPAFAMCLC